MKKSIFSKILALTLCLILALSSFTVNVFALNEDADLDMGDDVIITTIKDVYVSASGNDSNAGSESAPFATLAKATKRVSDGGTIHISGSYTVKSGDAWTSDRPNATVTVTGGTLNLSSDFIIGSNVTFTNITISGSKNLYANGKNVIFGSGATASAVTVYGGNNTGETLKSTNITLNGGTLGTAFGGNSVAGSINQVNLTINSGSVANVIGGSNAANLTGNVIVTLNGGTVSSSIFGGCYNEYKTTTSSSFMNYKHTYSWNSGCSVSGNVNVIIGDNVTLSIDSTTNEAIFAHSRHKTLSSSENSSIIFLSESKYSSTQSILGANDTYTASGWRESSLKAGLSHEMGKTVADSADKVHVHSITANDTADVITEGCTLKAPTSGASACETNTVTLTLNNASLKYTGEEITPMVAVAKNDLLLGEPVITYSNNVNPGTATATMTYGGKSVSQTFTIEKQNAKAPTALVAVPESISGKADGEIYGLTTEMEFSTNGTNYTAVTDTALKFAAGTYYVRYKETETTFASVATKVVIDEGRLLTVTFLVDELEEGYFEVTYGSSISEPPFIPRKNGYDKVEPYWDVADLSYITTDLIVNAVYTINTYTVKFVVDGEVISEQTVNYGASAVAPEIPAKEGYTETAPYWDTALTNVKSDLTITAVYTKDLPKITPADTDNDGKVNLNDLITLAQYVAGWQNTDAYIYALDINGDGVINLTDVNTLAQYLAGWNVTISTAPYMG